ncbi:MAG TPA: type II toxin-antitoxin system HicA family toxin [Spirochaetes bacterium]|nr:type II toxin-antitoxin system HicA family toxin [Spirochaetota bacterium]
MAKYYKLLEKLLSGDSDSNINFNDLCNLLNKLGFDKRTKGGHHIFTKEGVTELINLQKDTNKAKEYQVRQIRNIVLKYNIEGK